MDTTRNLSFDIAKGIIIILMVLGHSGCPDYLNTVCYLFRMPCFFLISGCLLNEKHFDNKTRFVKRKLKGLYKPFVKWSLIFLLLHNVLFYLHFYNNIYGFDDYKFKIFHILTMTGTEQLLGGFWFLKELLYASIIGFFVIYSLKRLKEKKYYPILLGGVSVGFIFLAYFASIAPFKIPTIGSRTLMACSYYTMGYLIRVTALKIPKMMLIPFCLILAPIPLFFQGSMDVVGTDIFIYYLSSLVGCGIVLCVSDILSKYKRVTHRLSRIGQSTLYILIFHFTSLKLVSLIVIYIKGLPIDQLSSFPIIPSAGKFTWIAYGLVGVLIPYLIWESKKKVESMLQVKRD